MKTYIIPIFIPHLGCKNECVFCNQRAISGNLKPIDEQDVKEIIEKHLEYFKDKENKQVEVAFFGGSFTGIDIEKQIRYLKIVQEYIIDNRVKSIRLSTRPDYIDTEILDNLKKYNVKTIELGIQSLDEEVLKLTKRGHTVKQVIDASNLINSYGFDLGHQVMIGLPESTMQKEKDTVSLSIKLKPKIARLYPTLVIKHTELEEQYNKKNYIPLTLEEAIERTKVLYNMYENNRVNVIRTGLHVTEDLTSDSSYVAGPMHSTFGQMVEASIMLDKVIERLVQVKNDKILITANSKTLNNIIGVNKSNITIIKDKYNKIIYKKIDNKLKYGDFEIKEIME